MMSRYWLEYSIGPCKHIYAEKFANSGNHRTENIFATRKLNLLIYFLF